MFLIKGRRMRVQATILFLQFIPCCVCFGDLFQQLPSFSSEDDDATTEDLATIRRLLVPAFMPSQPAIDETTSSLTPYSSNFDPDLNDNVLSPGGYETTVSGLETFFHGSINTSFVWDSADVSARDYQQSVCLQRCKDGQKVTIVNDNLACKNFECMPCMCEKPACEVYNICCPDITEPYIPPQGLDGAFFTKSLYSLMEPFILNTPSPMKAGNRSEEMAGAEEMNLGCDTASSSNGLIYIRSCPSRYLNEIVARLCEEDLPSEEISTDTITRVADVTTGAVYRNKFCAECNGVTEFTSFTLDIRCRHYMKLYTATEPNQLLSMIVAENETCPIRQRWPRNAVLTSCEHGVFYEASREVIGSCDNVTSGWTYDDDVARACRSMTKAVYRVSMGSKLVFYKNIFCAICHENSLPTYYSACKAKSAPTHRSSPALLPFQLLINFGNRARKQVISRIFPTGIRTTCTPNQWTSTYGECLPLICSPGKNLANGNCTTALSDIRGLGYNVKVWLVPSIEWSHPVVKALPYIPPSYLLDSLKMKLKDKLEEVSDNYSLSLAVITENSGDDHPDRRHAHLQKPVLYWISGQVTSQSDLARDDFEDTLTQLFLSPLLNISVANGVVSDFFPSVTMEAIPENDFCNKFTPSDHNKVTCSVTQLMADNPSKGNRYLWQERERFLNASNLLTCSYVKFNKSRYVMVVMDTVVPPSVTVEVDLNGTKVKIDDLTDLNYLYVNGDGSLDVCREVLDRRVRNGGVNVLFRRSDWRDGEGADDANRMAQYVLTMVCLGASMLCLLLTLFTYLRFPALMTTAGRNNTFLSLSLLLAQSFLIAASHLSAPSPVCTAVGILNHASWIWVFTWTFICSFNMFRVFTAKTRVTLTTREQNLQFVKKFMASLACPVGVVAIVIITSRATTDGSQLGYGDNVCYLDSTLLLGVSLVGPMAFFLVCNIAFFLAAVITIHKIHKLQSTDSATGKDKKNLYVYVKLSSMTGAFWIMAVISEAAENDVLRYVSIVLNGLQGVFIFISFMCNQRVLHLYSSCFISTSSSSTSSPQSQNEATETVTLDDGSKSAAKVRAALRFVHLANARSQHV